MALPNFTEALAEAVTGVSCALLAIGDEGTRWINSAIGVGGDYRNIAGAYRQIICNESDPDVEDFGPTRQFTGGQCDDIRYDVNFTWTKTTTTGSQPGVFGALNVFGPIKPLEQETFGNQVRLVWNQFATPQVVDSQSVATFESYSDIQGTVTPTMGEVDDCGDPPGDPIQEFNDFSQTVSITYEDNSQTQITEDVDITLGPLIVGIGGAVYAPVTVETPDFTFNGNLQISPTLNVELFPNGLFGGGGSTDTTPPDPDVDDPEPTVQNERRRIIGAIVTVTSYDESIAQVTQVAQGDTPDIFIPRTGNISFYIDTSGGQAWTEPKPLKNVREYVPCPAREGAVDVAVTAGTGFTLDVTPVYAELGID